jgi:hypothetical protein
MVTSYVTVTEIFASLQNVTISEFSLIIIKIDACVSMMYSIADV